MRISVMRIGTRLGKLLDRSDFRMWLAQRDGLTDTSYGAAFSRVAEHYAQEPGAAGRCTKLIANWENRHAR